jgi:hypothetical protein
MVMDLSTRKQKIDAKSEKRALEQTVFHQHEVADIPAVVRSEDLSASLGTPGDT